MAGTDSSRSARVALGAAAGAIGGAAVLRPVHGVALVAAWLSIGLGALVLLVIAFPPMWVIDPYKRWVIRRARYEQRYRCPNGHEFSTEVALAGSNWTPTDPEFTRKWCPVCGVLDSNADGAGMYSPNRGARWAVRRGYLGDQVTESRDR